MDFSYLWPPLMAGGIGTILLLVVSLRGKRQRAVHRVFGLVLFSITLLAFAIFGMRSSPDIEQALRWERAVPAIGFAVSLFCYHFSLIITNATRGRALLLGGYLLLGVLAGLSPTGLFIERMELQYYGYNPVLGPGLVPMLVVTYALSIMALYNLVRAYRSSTVGEEKNRFLYIIIAMLLPMIGGLFDLFPSVYPASIFGNIAFGLLTSIAVLRYHLLDIHVVMRKGVAYVLMSTIVAVPYVGIIILFNNLLGAESVSVWGYPVLLVVLALLLQPLWQIVQRVVDRMFFRERYDFLKELEYFSQESHDISDLKRLSSSLVGLISRALQTSNVQLLLLSEPGDFSMVSSAGDNASELTLRDHSPLLRWLQSNKGLLHYQDLDIMPQLQSLSAKERAELGQIGAELFVPLKTNKDELVGLLILGKKLSHQPYSEEDERLIAAVASRVAIELENARLYTMETMMRQALQRQDEQKTEFLHSVAHELKTPLTAIISSSELISTDAAAAPSGIKQRLIDNINRSAWIMDRRVGELLDLAKIQIGNLQLKLEPLEIGESIGEVTTQLSSLFKNKGQTLELEIEDFLPPVRADKERVQQVLLNLLSNANKFSAAGGLVVLRAKRENNSILVEVEDSAPVIAEEDREKVFDPYFRGGDDNERQRIPGLGLGLAISSRIVELHQGKIWIENETGRGNTFVFSLPTWNGEQA